ncbi:cysteine-rich RECEPTOR-like kinase [Rhynchospora pubera]|uniref:Cysteine-rich RECEPTOR-like kinase n=1 Tax=Rhynchospora pubera TaxID=906938 RepID=A0AAV8HHR3_9POAL|nr:cysteine-rich RECEPTOR-like kinase [Rhynchospora pubera]
MWIQGGFGVVYKGLIDGETVAIKHLNGSSVKLLEDIAKEVSLLSSLNNNNLVKLLGFCSEAGRYVLVYEYISNGDLRGSLVDNKRREILSWEKRFKIIKGIAGGLSYLHHNSGNVVIHRDLKPENILLDEHCNPKIADFGLSRAFETEKTHITTKKLAGTLGYFAPELWFQWQYSTRSDVYSYGLLVLEMLAGFTIPQYAKANQETFSHVMWKQWKHKRPLAEVIDSSLHENCAMDEIAHCYVIGLLCVQHDPKRRPDMKLVLQMLHNNIDLPTPSFPGFFQECENPQDLSSPSEFEPAKHARPEDASSSDHRRAEHASSSDQHQPPEYARPGYSSSYDELSPSVPKEYSLEDLKIITDNFSCVLFDIDCIKYKGLLNRRTVAVEEYSHYRYLQNLVVTTVSKKKKFIFFGTEKTNIKRHILQLRHPNIINILGYCLEVKGKLFIIYKYPKNGDLQHYLYDSVFSPEYSEEISDLSWISQSTTNLACVSWDAKLCGLSLAIVLDENQEHLNIIPSQEQRRILAPEAANLGVHTVKSDVYNYGAILLQILVNTEGYFHNLIITVYKHWLKKNNKKIMELMDPRLENKYPEAEALRYIQISLLCIQYIPDMRPSMQQVVEMLDNNDPLPYPTSPSEYFGFSPKNK